MQGWEKDWQDFVYTTKSSKPGKDRFLITPDLGTKYSVSKVM